MFVKAQQLNLLIVEDDQNLASSLRLLAPDCFKVFVAQKLNLIPDHVFFHAALVDMHLSSDAKSSAPVPDGLKALEIISKKNPQTELVAMSGKFDRNLMEEAIHSGAQKFLAKPLVVDEVQSLLKKIEAYWILRLSNHQNSNHKLIGTSERIEAVRKTISMLKSERNHVLIEGDTGTGKEVVAQLLHEQEGATPFVSINCSAVSDSLFESEFFGHIKGAFTGADQNKIGLAEAAHGGDLFLDEIEAMPLNQQAKLLRFIESGEIKKVGAKENQHVSVRLIVASNVPLKNLIAEKKFREDLYFRLSSHRIELPPLKSRPSDIPLLAQNFLEASKPKSNKTFDTSGIEALKKYHWPGNVRELKRVCEQLSLIAPLPILRDVDVEKVLGTNAHYGSSIQYNLNQSLEELLSSHEKNYIEFCLNQLKDLDKCCDILKISKSNLYKKIKDLGITYES